MFHICPFSCCWPVHVIYSFVKSRVCFPQLHIFYVVLRLLLLLLTAAVIISHVWKKIKSLPACTPQVPVHFIHFCTFFVLSIFPISAIETARLSPAAVSGPLLLPVSACWNLYLHWLLSVTPLNSVFLLPDATVSVLISRLVRTNNALVPHIADPKPFMLPVLAYTMSSSTGSSPEDATSAIKTLLIFHQTSLKTTPTKAQTNNDTVKEGEKKKSQNSQISSKLTTLSANSQ